MLRENYSYDCLLIWLITPTQQFLKLYHGKNKLISNEMMMRSTLYLTNTLSAGSLKQQSTDRHVAPLGHISLIPSQPLPVFALINAVCLAEKQQIPKVWSDRGSNPRSTTLETRTHDLPHSRLEPTIYHTRDSNPRSTTLETRTYDLPHSRLEPTIYHTRDSNLRSTTLETRTYDLPHSSTPTITPQMLFSPGLCWSTIPMTLLVLLMQISLNVCTSLLVSVIIDMFQLVFLCLFMIDTLYLYIIQHMLILSYNFLFV
jgi:hypothetical protein